MAEQAGAKPKPTLKSKQVAKEEAESQENGTYYDAEIAKQELMLHEQEECGSGQAIHICEEGQSKISVATDKTDLDRIIPDFNVIENEDGNEETAEQTGEFESILTVSAPVFERTFESVREEPDVNDASPKMTPNTKTLDDTISVDLNIQSEVSDREVQDAAVSSQACSNELAISNTKITREERSYKIPTIQDLEKLYHLVGRSWNILYLLIADNNKGKMIEVTEDIAKRYVIMYFAQARENVRKKIGSPFDVTLGDLVTRIEHLEACDIHWLCIVYHFRNEKSSGDMLSIIYRQFPDLVSFWFAISMPHYNCRFENVKFSSDSYCLLSKELKEIKDEMDHIDTDVNLSDSLKEDKKFCSFLTKTKLVEYAKINNIWQYCRKFLILYKMKINTNEWYSFIKSIGIEAVEKKKSADHICITYHLVNKSLLGEKVISKNGGEGSLGYIFKKDGLNYQITSLHVLMDGKIFKEIKGKKNELREIHSECQVVRIGTAVVKGGIYAEGDDQSSGVEIVFLMLINTSSIPPFTYENAAVASCGAYPLPPLQAISASGKRAHVVSFESNTSDIPFSGAGSVAPDIPPLIDHLYYHWKRHDFPDVLYFKGKRKEKIRINSSVFTPASVTGVAKGTITETDCTFEFDYPSKEQKNNFFHKFFRGSEPEKVSLRNQYKVEWESGEFPFSDVGDSGGPVYEVNKETGEITAVGILTGNNETLQCSYVTPIKDILIKIDANELVHFELYLTEHTDIVKEWYRETFANSLRTDN